MDETHDSTDPFADGPITPERIAGIVALIDVAVFAFIGYSIADAPEIGALAGLFVGAGIFLFLPVFMRAGEDGDLESLAPDDPGHPLRSFNRVAAGFSIGPGGIVMLMPLFTELNPLLGIPAGVLVAVVLYIPLAWVLPNAQI